MKTTWKNRLIALLLTCGMALSFAACDGNQTDAGTSTAGDGKLFTEATTIRWVIPSHPSWPFNKDWVVWTNFEELTGANFDITAIPTDNYVTKLTLMMAEGGDALPDIIAGNGKTFADTLASEGALIAIDDYQDQMPNYTAFWNSLDEEDRENRLVQRKYSDGKTYYPQVYGTDKLSNIRTWLYRKDIFEKNNLAVPTTLDELYEVCKQLKALYPESYPFCMRNGIAHVDVLAPAWDAYLSTGYYYDFESDKWTHGVLEPKMLELVTFLRKMYQEGLLSPGYLTDPTKTWEELMSTDRGFITCDYVVRIDNFNSVCRQENPEYTLAAMMPPKADTETGTNFVNKLNMDMNSAMIPNTGNKDRILNAIKLVDWMYSDTAADMVWGVEGVSYNVDADGNKRFIREAGEDIQNKYGVFCYGTYLRADPKAAEEFASDEQKPSVDLALQYTHDKANPTRWLALSDEQQSELNLINDSIGTYVETMLHKYLLCEEPIETWDNFVAEVKNLGIENALAIYEEAYNSVK